MYYNHRINRGEGVSPSVSLWVNADGFKLSFSTNKTKETVDKPISIFADVISFVEFVVKQSHDKYWKKWVFRKMK